MRFGKSSTRKTIRRLEDKVLAAAGRRSLKRKTAAMSAVTRKAIKAAAIAAGMAAAGVVFREARKLGKA